MNSVEAIRHPAISAVVVSCNEAEMLERCLPALAFCDELVVVDLESTDETAATALRHGARLCPHQRVPHVEMILEWLAAQCRNDWVLSIDPDEFLDPSLARQLTALMEDMRLRTCGSVELPMQFYFGNHALRGTYWGGVNHKRGVFFHRDRVVFSQEVHQRPVAREGYDTLRLPWGAGNVLHHYWMSGYRQFLEKHLRYLQAEGARRYREGQRFSWGRTVYDTAFAFAWSLIRRKSYQDGLLGFALSGLYAWYVGSSWLSLRRYELSLRRGAVV